MTIPNAGRTIGPILSVMLAAGSAIAQDRPDEGQLFGASPAQPAATKGDSGGTTRDAAATGGTVAAAPPASAATPPASTPSISQAEDDPLRIGGQLYLRTLASGQDGQRLGEYALSAPALLDVYLDARPSDRVRGFVLTRIGYDPTGSGTGAVPGASPIDTSVSSRDGSPVFAIDQAWLRFDVARTIFVTAGKQHVRWGTGRFWMPTDFLHLRKRNPLDVFDARVGTSMLKLHIPVESRAWNFYGFALTEQPDGTGTLNKLAYAARAEFTFGTTELGLGGLVRKGQSPRFAADISSGIGNFDLYSEVAVVDSGEVDRVAYDPYAAVPPPMPPPSWERPEATALRRVQETVSLKYPAFRSSGYRPQVVGGATYTLTYNDTDKVIIGGEYFYNALGYSKTDAYPGLVLPRTTELVNAAQFFYVGRHYGAAFVSFPSPFALNLHTFTLSTLGNLSDRSFITRLDYSLTLLTHLTFEAFTAVHYGSYSGEFRFGIRGVDIAGQTVSISPSRVDLGLGLRLAL
jgi:hypothetical protein